MITLGVTPTSTPHEIQMWMRQQINFMETHIASPETKPLVVAYLRRCREIMLADLIDSQIKNFDRG